MGRSLYKVHPEEGITQVGNSRTLDVLCQRFVITTNMADQEESPTKKPRLQMSALQLSVNNPSTCGESYDQSQPVTTSQNPSQPVAQTLSIASDQILNSVEPNRLNAFHRDGVGNSGVMSEAVKSNSEQVKNFEQDGRFCSDNLNSRNFASNIRANHSNCNQYRDSTYINHDMNTLSNIRPSIDVNVSSSATCQSEPFATSSYNYYTIPTNPYRQNMLGNVSSQDLQNANICLPPNMQNNNAMRNLYTMFRNHAYNNEISYQSMHAGPYANHTLGSYSKSENYHLNEYQRNHYNNGVKSELVDSSDCGPTDNRGSRDIVNCTVQHNLKRNSYSIALNPRTCVESYDQSQLETTSQYQSQPVTTSPNPSKPVTTSQNQSQPVTETISDCSSADDLKRISCSFLTSDTKQHFQEDATIKTEPNNLQNMFKTDLSSYRYIADLTEQNRDQSWFKTEPTDLLSCGYNTCKMGNEIASQNYQRNTVYSNNAQYGSYYHNPATIMPKIEELGNRSDPSSYTRIIPRNDAQNVKNSSSKKKKKCESTVETCQNQSQPVKLENIDYVTFVVLSPTEYTLAGLCRNSVASQFLALELKLAQELQENLQFTHPVTHIYNPLEYAVAPHGEYVRRYCVGAEGGQTVMFLGMNPGPYGMVQTGVAFGEVNLVRDWLGICEEVRKPDNEHPKRPVTGFTCTRREVSGARFWGYFSSRCGTPDRFFRRCFVHNMCPLVFMNQNGKNLTPPDLPLKLRKRLNSLCDSNLCQVVRLMGIKTVIGVGNYAQKRALCALKSAGLDSEVNVKVIMHPSPANPAANRGWGGIVDRQLTEMGLDQCLDE